MSLDHIYLEYFTTNQAYKTKNRGGSTKRLPSRDHSSHGTFLLDSIDLAFQEFSAVRKNSKLNPILNQEDGIYLEIFGDKNYPFPIESLDNTQIHFRNIRESDDNNLMATVFIPMDQRQKFISKISKYIETADDVKPKNYILINSIDYIRLATLKSFWTDKKDFPANVSDPMWFELWLQRDRVDDEMINVFCHSLDADFNEQRIDLPNTSIILVKASIQSLEKSLFLISNLLEIKYPTTTASDFLDLESSEHNEWVNDLASRVISKNPCDIRVTILDTGINYNHNLLSPFISASSSSSYGDSVVGRWPLYSTLGNHHHHGSLQAGLVIYGNLVNCLESTDPISINYALESGRILPEYGHNDPLLYGYVTKSVCLDLEIRDPYAKRVYSLAVTAESTDGKPSSWSASIDNFTYEDSKRLFVISAGNNPEIFSKLDAWDNASLSKIQDPAQSWNAITVGAYTEHYNLKNPTYKGWRIFSDIGEVSPATSSSVNWVWGKNSPIKPEVVFEGGNYAISPCGTDFDYPEDLLLLTTAGVKNDFTVHKDTSAATALASKFLAEITHKYPNYWPETLRGLLIHSAEWNDKMKAYAAKTNVMSALRTFGYGIPHLQRALNSQNNSATIVVERELNILKVEKNGDIRFDELHHHKVPIPKELILKAVTENPTSLGRLKITLSYFIEPNPTSNKYATKYAYRSFGLGFNVKSPSQSEENFLATINSLAVDENYTGSQNSYEGWLFKDDFRRLGSIHSDTWEGSIADLVSMDTVVVFPIYGWWKNSKFVREDYKVRYSLIISVESDSEIDIYNGIESLIAVEQQAKTLVSVEA
ncbi:S8 family peptidase [Acinetobacter nosocomialis]|uniref:S8 family peptidase n=1 Tax=Acinetobacter nosocomialis TaxID=106654 RepID=UPI0023B18F5B|nr:S8 family peptidase [Acinetobacter nosocomialis]MDE9410307.1 S8 family peptidase [Acinetobacter nosocomialis]